MSDQNVRFIYFPGRGRGEIIRIMLCAAGIQFEDKELREREEFVKLLDGDELLFEQVPLLYIDGQKLVQSGAILRHLARRAGMQGSNETEMTRVDVLTQGAADYQQGFIRAKFVPDEEIFPMIKAKVLPRYIPIFDKILKESGTGFLVGNSMTVADVQLLEAVLSTRDYFGMEEFDGYPGMQKFINTMLETDGIKHYMENVRRPKNDEKYIATVKRVLNW